ncbi:MAG: hypothetical protein WDZ90_00155 [Candidatus Paceibacterota bacterium]
MNDGRKKITLIGGFIIGVLLVSYALFQARDLIEGPVIALSSPENGATIIENGVFIEGHAKNIARISLNDHQIFVDESGYFKERILLPEGYAILVIKGSDRFGRKTQEIISLYHAKES